MEMKQSGRPKYRRRNYFIKKGLQGKFVIGLSLVVLLGVLLNLALAYFFLDRELAGELYKIHLKISTTSELAWPVLWKIGAVTLPVALIAAVLAAYYFTRRLEPPIRVFVANIRRLANGDFSEKPGPIAVEGLGEALGKAHGGLESRLASFKSGAKALEEAFAKVVAAAGKKDAATELQQAIGEFSRQRIRLGREAARFKL